jgi:hypothetical protein
VLTCITAADKYVLEVIQEKWFGHIKRMPGNKSPQRTLKKKRPEERWME